MIYRWGKDFTKWTLGPNPLTNTTSSQNRIINNGNTKTRLRYISMSEMMPGHTMPYHEHTWDNGMTFSEVFVFIDGQFMYNDNGLIHLLGPGDTGICPLGTGHSVGSLSEDAPVYLIEMGVYPTKAEKAQHEAETKE